MQDEPRINHKTLSYKYANTDLELRVERVMGLMLCSR